MSRYTVVGVQKTEAGWGTTYVADIRIQNDVTLYIIGPAYSEQELIQKVLDRFGK